MPVPGYHGRYLEIDVTTGASRARELSPAVLRATLGGAGLGTHLLQANGAAGLDPLEPAAPLAFVFSPLVGSPLTTSAKFAVVSKSPLTLRLNDSLASSGFALAGKRTGFDALVVMGRAARPSVLVIEEGRVRLDPADEVWGQSCPAAQETLRHRYGGEFAAAVIGPAGERQVLYATISHDGRHAGRGGSGAVLGAKNIKAILVRGEARCEWAFPAELATLARQLSRRSLGEATAKYRELGTAANLLAFNRLQALPTRNFQASEFEGAEALAPETLATERAKARASCVACTIGCEHIYGLAPGAGELGPGERGVRLEYESLFALGPLCGVGDSGTVLAASQRCDELGLDTISAGGTLAFAMECVERGLLQASWLRFGSSEALLQGLDLIASRAGLGDWLAQGSRRLAERLGGEALDFAPQVKGLEIPGYEPRALQAMALGFAVGSRGADHNRSGAYEVDFSPAGSRRDFRPEQVSLAVETENRAALMDSLILCKFLRRAMPEFYEEAAHMLRLVTGWEVSAAELQATAQCLVTAKKRFNIAAGWTPAEDTLPARFLQTAPTNDATAVLTAERLRELVRAYNLARGWSAEGWPPGEAR